MQIPLLSSMALTLKDKSMFKYLDVAGNLIGNEGSEILSQSKWVNLKMFKLSFDNISSDGVKYLSQSNWPLLEYL